MSYKPPYRITERILSLVAEISEKLGRITEGTNLDSKPHLRKNNKIRSIHSSLTIEANSLSLEEVRDVINGRPVIGEQKEIQEVKNAYEAYSKIGDISLRIRFHTSLYRRQRQDGEAMAYSHTVRVETDI